MKNSIKEIVGKSFYQLLLVYSALILAISLNLFWKYTYHFELFALIIAILGTFEIRRLNTKSIDKRLLYSLFIFAIVLILLTRIIPYLDNNIPIGYDAGIYKYGIESFAKDFFNADSWVKGALEPGFLYLTTLLKLLFNTQTILISFFILCNVLLGFSIYKAAKEYFNETSAIIALMLYSVSSIQYLVFTYLYYKNILGLSFMLFAFYFLKREDNLRFIIFGILTGIIHRPTFYLFGLSYLTYTIYDYNNIKQNIKNGISILIFTAIFYIGFFKESILPLIKPVAESFISPGSSAGTFINFFTYQYSTLAYLAFSILGFFYLIQFNKFNILTFYTGITAIIVYFQLFFFNRFIIHLDIALIILAGAGFNQIITRKLGFLITLILLFSAGFVTINHAISTNSLINQNELETIVHVSTLEKDAYIMTTNSIYSPWVLGYSTRKTIAPGLFNYNLHNKEEWTEFWTADNQTKLNEFMDKYEQPLYIFIGEQQKDNLKQFDNCMLPVYEKESNVIYRYIC